MKCNKLYLYTAFFYDKCCNVQNVIMCTLILTYQWWSMREQKMFYYSLCCLSHSPINWQLINTIHRSFCVVFLYTACYCWRQYCLVCHCVHSELLNCFWLPYVHVAAKSAVQTFSLPCSSRYQSECTSKCQQASTQSCSTVLWRFISEEQIN